jgi:hypothetical protein
MHVDNMYKDRQMPGVLKFVIILFFFSIVTALTYFSIERYYEDEGFEERVELLKSYLRLRRRELKEREIDEKEMSRLHNECFKCLDEKNHKDLRK